MSTEQHTAGPWELWDGDSETPHIIAQQGKRWDNPTICTFYDDVTPEDSVTIGAWYEQHENFKANARLISAAPDMLEALQFLMTAHGEQLSTAFEMAQSAIAKATGVKQ